MRHRAEIKYTVKSGYEQPEWVLIFEGCLFSWGANKRM